MTVKEKLARQALAKIDRRLAKIKAIQEAEPLSVIMDLRKQAQALLQDDTDKGVSDNTLKALQALAKEEKKQNRLFKQQCNTKLIEEKVALESERRDLVNELYYINLARQDALLF